MYGGTVMQVVTQVDAGLLQIFGPVGVVILYLFYEFHYGRVAKFQETLAAYSGAIVALARHNDGVDEEAIAATMPDDIVQPQRLYSGSDEEEHEETLEQLAEMITDELEKVTNTDEGE